MIIPSILHLVSGLSSSMAEPRLFEARLESASGERELIQRHLAEVESTLRVETPATLTAAQASARSALLDALHAYWVRGRFPRNLEWVDRRVPHFIDDSGTACAVGHLMIASGASDLAREIATYENNDFVADIDHPGLGQWLAAHGLTAAEAAWIQPTYSACNGEPYVCGVDGETYECAAAADCADVEVDYEGACGADTDGDTEAMSEPPDVEVDEVCKDKGCAIAASSAPQGAALAVVVLVFGAVGRRRNRARSV